MVEPRLCGCGAALGPRNTTGRCRSCGCRRAWATPEGREKARARSRKAHATMSRDPVQVERRRAWGRHLAANVLSGEAWAKSQTAEARRRAGEKNTERMLGWCPAEYRPLYRQLRHQKFSAAEARSLIEREVARTAEAEVAALRAAKPATFDEQLAAVAAGAKVVAKFEPRRADPEMTLGGVATGMI